MVVLEQNLVGLVLGGGEAEGERVELAIPVEGGQYGGVLNAFSASSKEYFLGKGPKFTRTSPLMNSSCFPLILKQFLEYRCPLTFFVIPPLIPQEYLLS